MTLRCMFDCTSTSIAIKQHFHMMFRKPCDAGCERGKITNLASHSAPLHIHYLEITPINYPQGSLTAPVIIQKKI